MHAGISVAASPGCRHRQPHFIRRAHPIRDLQQQIEGEAELHLHDRQRQPLSRPNRDDVAALDLALHVEAGRLQEALDGRIERGFGHEGHPATASRVAATAISAKEKVIP